FGSRIVPVGPPNYIAPPKPTLSRHPSGAPPADGDTDPDSDAAAPAPEPPGLPTPPVTNSKPKPVVQKHMKLSLWDTAGQETRPARLRHLAASDIRARPRLARGLAGDSRGGYSSCVGGKQVRPGGWGGEQAGSDSCGGGGVGAEEWGAGVCGDECEEWGGGGEGVCEGGGEDL
ncbi:hypothetical protein V490_02379, partial [Pseudogymnoascus sp. VKM F-3557]